MTLLQLAKKEYSIYWNRNEEELINLIDSLEWIWLKDLLKGMLSFDANTRFAMSQAVSYLPRVNPTVAGTAGLEEY